MSNHLKEWVEALESGEYKQAQHELHNSFGFCCLGVACDLYPKGEWVGKDFVVDDEDGTFRLDTDLNGEMREWIGIEKHEEERLIEMNDKEEATFNDIAVQIRGWYPEVFA